MPIIASSGKKGSGKDTVAKLIQCLTCTDDDWFKDNPTEVITKWGGNYDNLGEWKVKKFAGRLKEIVSLLTGISIQNLEKEEVKQRKLEDWKVWKLTFPTEHNDFYYTVNKWFLTEDEARDFADDNYLIGFQLEEIVPDVRFLLQYIGTDLFRNQLHPDVWVNSLFSEYKYSHILSIIDPPITVEKIANSVVYPKWIISDLRFPNELKAVQDRNGICVRINRPETDKLAGDHLSETALDDRQDWDWVFDNSKDLNHLLNQVKEFVKFYKL